MPPFEYKYPPLEHQREVLRQSHHLAGYALFMDPGTGKTYVVIANTVYLFETGDVDGLLILAPNNVHVNWITDELPKHVPDRTPWRAVIWRTGEMSRSVEKKRVWKPELDALLDFTGLAVLAMNFEAVLSAEGEKFARQFLRRRRTVLGLDEADEYLASPGSKRFQRIIAFARGARVRRPMTGTPVDEAPEHAYGIMRAVESDFWAKGEPPLKTYKEFKAHIQITETRTTADGHDFPVVVGHKNLDWLSARLFAKSYRYRKDDMGLPPKIYQKAFVELSAEQWRMYDEMVQHDQAMFASGEFVTAKIKLVSMLRRQQIVCGYVPPDLDALEVPDWSDPEAVEAFEETATAKTLQLIPGRNNRLETAEWVLERTRGKTIIWCRFTPDVDLLMGRLDGYAVRFDGQISAEERLENKERYLKDSRMKYLVGNPRAGGRGYTLVNTEHMMYYSNYFSGRIRTQSEDRAHRIGLTHSVLYTDLCALKTVDTYIIDRLRAKKELSALIMRDPVKEWI